jgi:hypothetical protein
MTVFDSYVKVVGNDTVEGYVHDGHFCAGHDEHMLLRRTLRPAVRVVRHVDGRR